ncbi:MAG: tetratricopeptide repeat protein, partial [Bacteroidota bacterium]|nr:tetratricopeptide repeat protein [Bacteroidota bacterium]
MKQFKRNIGLLVLLFLSSQIITLGKADLENPDREEQKIQQIESLLQKSDKYLHLDLFDQAFVYADSALQLANSIEHIESITQSLLSESNIYFVQKKFAKAINIYFELIYYFNSTDNIESNAFVYKQIAYLYTKLKKYDNAIIYFNKSIGYSEKIGNDKSTANLNIDRGRVMVLNNEFANAEESFRKALEIAIELNNRYLIIKSKIELALLYDIAGNVDAAETTINAIEQLLIKSENDTLKAEYFHALSSIMFHSRSFDDAVNNSKKSLALCRKMDIPDLIESNFKLLQEIAISQRNYKTALLYSNKYAEYLILKSQEQHSETLRDSQIVLEIEHQEKELEKLRAEKIHQQELLYGKTRLIYALFALGLMAMIVALLLYFRAKSRKKAIEKEKKQKEKIERQNKRLAKTNEKLAEAKADAEFARDSAIKADKAKTAFLDIMSHEIRTPIAGIIGMINVLKDIDLDDDKREKLFIIEQSSNDLLDIFNDILEFVKLESGNLVIEKSEFSLRNAISEVELLNVNRAKKKGLVLKVNIDKEIPDSLVGDEMRIQQVLKSLLSNAIKFTEKGKVVLNIKYFGQTVDNCSFRVEVIDTGIGMTMSEIKSIFTAFSAVNT